MSDTQHHWSNIHPLCHPQTHNWALIPAAVTPSQAGRAWPTTAAGKNKTVKEEPKVFYRPDLPTHTERPSRRAGWATQSRRHRGNLHHIKGNIFLKNHAHTEELLRHRQSHLHSAVCHVQNHSDEQTVLSFRFADLFLKQLHRIKMGFLTQH